MVKEMGTF
jgi:hypothetical protein